MRVEGWGSRYTGRLVVHSRSRELVKIQLFVAIIRVLKVSSRDGPLRAFRSCRVPALIRFNLTLIQAFCYKLYNIIDRRLEGDQRMKQLM